MGALISTFGIDWHALIAEVINFAILIAALTWLLYKPVLKMVRDREALIAKGVDDAEEAGRKLASADSTASGIVAKADGEAGTILASARKSATDEKARIVKEAEARAVAIATDAEARAQEAAARTLRESEKEIARLAVLAAAKAISQGAHK